MKTPTIDEIKAFCKEHDVSFYSMGCPDNWDDPTVFRIGTFEFHVRGYTVPISKVVEWYENPPYLGEGI